MLRTPPTAASNRRAALPLAALVALAAIAHPAAAQPRRDLAQARPLAISAVRCEHHTAPIHQRVTLHVQLHATYDNPFDSRQVRLDADVTGPSGTGWTIPGFLYQAFERRLEQNSERLKPLGKPAWQLRFSAMEPGPHTIAVRASDRSGAVAAEPVVITATAADVPGRIRRHPQDQRYFVTDRGETFFPVGANVCWGGSGGTFDYDRWLPRYAEQGGNFFRVWLNPEWFTFALNTRASGYDSIELGNAWRLDHVLQTAERLGLRVMLCIDSFNILRYTREQHGNFENTPYVRSNGGPLDRPLEYFTNEDSQRAFRDRLRYLVARYGASPNVFAWEFWNEVDIISGYDSRTVTDWHREMARHLRSLDPWRTLITTSTANPPGDPRLDALSELEFVQTHRYGAADMAEVLGEDRATKWAARDRPHFHGEFGIGHSGTRTRETDPAGVHLHNGLYASVGQLQAGTPMTWWWDSYVDPNNLYPIFGAFARWIEGFDFVAQQVRPLEARAVYLDPAAPRPLEDVLLRTAAGSWQPADFNQPVTVRVAPDGQIEQTAPLSQVLHGLSNHRRLHNPATFELDVIEPTRFIVQVRGVSGHGGARLEISVDGQAVREVDLPDPDGTEQTDTLHQYDGDYAIELPAGRRTVRVRNTGRDWLYVGYQIPRLVRPAEPPLRVLGVVGRTAALVWVQDRQHTWPQATREGFQARRIAGAGLELTGLNPGNWTIQTWDTHRGEVTRTQRAAVAADGRLSLPLPEIVWDMALRLQKD